MIKKLSKDTIDKIAAGEVVERPMSVVKELVENAIDAGADSITVEIRNGGIDLIRITDNGCGIPAGEVRTAFEAHATSKITDADDLNSISSLGFRGEALSSISAVTRCEIITKPQDAVTAVRFVTNGGAEESFSEIGAPDGTTIITRDLFFNVPVRRKFLKSGMTEAAHIAELMEKLALSHPEIAFRLIQNGQLKLQTPGNGNLKDVIFRVYGRDITNALIPVSYDRGKVKVTGYIGRPELSRPNRNFENYFINGRTIRSAVISNAIEDAYGNRMMQHQFPVALLLLETDPSDMDVNVHPTKMEVRFARPSSFYDEIHTAVREALEANASVPRAMPETGRAEIRPAFTAAVPKSESFAPAQKEEPVLRPAEPFERKRLTEEKLPAKSAPPTENDGIRLADLRVAKPVQETLFPENPAAGTIPAYRLIGQVFQTYWMIETGNRLLLMDQHAAHEKVNYERLLKQYKEGSVTSQLLNPPVILTLTKTEWQAVEENLEDFVRAGYEIEPFGGNEYAVRSLPAALPSLPGAELLSEMIAGYTRDSEVSKDPLLVLEKTASMACKASVKGGQRISFHEADLLVQALLQCENPYCCPHGRPTVIEFTQNDLEKKFKRVL